MVTVYAVRHTRTDSRLRRQQPAHWVLPAQQGLKSDYRTVMDGYLPGGGWQCLLLSLIEFLLRLQQ